MVADPLTKAMEPVELVEMLDTNAWNIARPLEAVLKKRGLSKPLVERLRILGNA